MQYQVIDLESRLRAAQKQLESKEMEYDRCLAEKNDAQAKQFLLQQELNANSAKHLELLQAHNDKGYDLSSKLIANQNMKYAQTYNDDRDRQGELSYSNNDRRYYGGS
jgi:hypothetical protein